MISDRHFSEITVSDMIYAQPKTYERIQRAMRDKVAATVWDQRKRDIGMGLNPSERKMDCTVKIDGLMLIPDEGGPFGGTLKMSIYTMIDAAFSVAQANPYLTIAVVGWVRRTGHGCAVRHWMLPINRLLKQDIREQKHGAAV